MPYYTDTIELIRSQAKGAALAQVLGSHKAVLMRNHGVAVVGASIEESTILVITLESACQIQLAAMGGGGIGDTFASEQIQRLHKDMNHAEQYAINFEYLRRKLRGTARN